MNVTPLSTTMPSCRYCGIYPTRGSPSCSCAPVLQTKLKLPVVKNKGMKRAHNTKNETKDSPPIKDKLPTEAVNKKRPQLPIESVDKLPTEAMNEKRPQLPIESVDESHAKEVERKRNIDEECLTKKGVKRTKRAAKESGSTVVKPDPAPIHRRRRRLI
ncbi:hypothetical protein B0O80DRAFT_473265, partial [Mortierella sp. GBAus27b]